MTSTESKQTEWDIKHSGWGKLRADTALLEDYLSAPRTIFR